MLDLKHLSLVCNRRLDFLINDKNLSVEQKLNIALDFISFIADMANFSSKDVLQQEKLD